MLNLALSSATQPVNLEKTDTLHNILSSKYSYEIRNTAEFPYYRALYLQTSYYSVLCRASYANQPRDVPALRRVRARLAVALAAVRVSPLQRLEVPAARRRRTRRGVPTGG